MQSAKNDLTVWEALGLTKQQYDAALTMDSVRAFFGGDKQKADQVVHGMLGIKQPSYSNTTSK